MPPEQFREVLPLHPPDIHVRDPVFDLGLSDPVNRVEGDRLLRAGGERLSNARVRADERPDGLYTRPEVPEVPLDTALVLGAVVI